MRSILLITTVLILVMAAPSLAQEWTDYTSKTDFFHVNFPGDPKVQDINYQTEYGITLPGHVYTVASGPGRYSVTVVDYAGAEKIHTAKADQCKKAGGEGDACGNGWRGDVQGAIVYASFQFFQRPGVKVTHYAWYNTDQVEGHRLQLTNADGSRTFASIYMHENRLYIVDGTVPANSPPPMLFQQSMGFLDKQGKRIRYNSTYSNGFPAPARAR